jgi:hypothetical protein
LITISTLPDGSDKTGERLWARVHVKFVGEQDRFGVLPG